MLCYSIKLHLNNDTQYITSADTIQFEHHSRQCIRVDENRKTNLG